jgi:hypothetical protein
MLRQRLSGLPRDAMVSVNPVERVGFLTRPWISWLQAVVSELDAATRRVQTVSVQAEAAIPPTAVPVSGIPAALYRVTFTLRILRAASTSSSAAVTLGWTDSGVACSQTWPAATGNTPATVQTGTVLMRVDKDGPITYGVAYSSVGGTSMRFALDLVVELLPGVAT